MDDIIQDFLAETNEGMEALDSDLLQLEKTPDDKELLDRIFRVIHSIKGASGFLDLKRLAALAHAGENVLDKMREGQLAVSESLMSLIFDAIDALKALLTHIEKNAGIEPEGDDATLIAKLNIAAAENTQSNSLPQESQQEEDNLGTGDSDEMQALFDATPSLVDISAIDTTADSDEMQALFDATPSLVDMEMPATTEAKPLDVPACSMNRNEEKEAVLPKSESKKASSNQTVRVNVELLEVLMQQASELVLTRNQLLQMIRDKENSEFLLPLQRLDYITSELQEGVMKTRMQAISNAWTPLPRIVRDLARDLGKKIELVMDGGDTELDRQLLEYIKDPLTHMVRNSADHGVEMPQERLHAGKSELGKIHLSAYHEGGYINIRISDDGKGLDSQKIKEKIIEKSLATEQEVKNLSDKQIYQYIFKPGFSTAAQVTAVSGRGVGMDVVRTNIENIGGSIELDSTLGQGSCFTIKIPLTLAIMSVLVVEAGKQRFALPQISINEIVRTQPHKEDGLHIELIDNHPVLRLRGNLLPLQYLTETLGIEEQPHDVATPDYVVICAAAEGVFGLVVDKVFDTEEIVVKPLVPMLNHLEIYAGITILGDGKAVLLLDSNGLSRNVGGAIAQKVAEHNQRDTDVEIAQFVQFRLQDETPKVVPMELVSRLEEINVAEIEYAHGQPIMQYRNQIMHLCLLDGNDSLPKEGTIEVLVSYNGQHVIGLVVKEVVDIVHASLTHEIERESDGYMGSVVIGGRACDIIDVEYHFVKIFGGSLPNVRASLEGEIQANGAKPVVLFVEDSPFFRKFIPPEFEAAGFSVLTATQGEHALQMLEAHPEISLIVTDMNMPCMNGVELLAACKSDERFAHMPIIALSSHQQEEMTLGVPLEGVFAYVSKNNHAQLVEKVKEALDEIKQAV